MSGDVTTARKRYYKRVSMSWGGPPQSRRAWAGRRTLELACKAPLFCWSEFTRPDIPGLRSALVHWAVVLQSPPNDLPAACIDIAHWTAGTDADILNRLRNVLPLRRVSLGRSSLMIWAALCYGSCITGFGAAMKLIRGVGGAPPPVDP